MIHFQTSYFKEEDMIFLVIGIFFCLIGALHRLLPSKGNLPFYGYHSPLAGKSDAHWFLAQKTSGTYFLLAGLFMTIIGYLLTSSGNTNYFLVEILLLIFPILPVFLLTEKKLQKYDREHGGDTNEYTND
jgi:uncharacterized membrane protein